MAKVKWIDVDIYKCQLAVFIGGHEEFKKWVKKEYTDPSEEGFVELVMESTDEAQASLWWNGDRSCIIELPYWPRKPKELGWANHELLHSTFHILDGARVEYHKGESNESFTYLLEYLTKNLYDKEGYETV